MADENKNEIGNKKELMLISLDQQILDMWKFLVSKWSLIIVLGVIAGLIGLGLSYIVKPKYTANLSFSLNEKSSGGGLAGLALSFGFGGLLGNSGGDAFTGDNLLEIIKSRYAVETTLLSPIDFEGEQMTMIDAYIKFNELPKKWQRAKNEELKTIKFPINQDRTTFSRTQDSVLYTVYDKIVNQNELKLLRKNKNINIIYVNFTSQNESFAKYFVEILMDKTYDFYKETRTAQTRNNLAMMQNRADSIRELYENALYKGAAISQVNVNTAIQLASVPRLKQEYDVQLYGTVYAEVLKNLETIRLDMDRETPIVQIIDRPIYPLKKTELGKLKGIVFGAFTGGVIVFIYLCGLFFFKRKLYRYF